MTKTTKHWDCRKHGHSLDKDGCCRHCYYTAERPDESSSSPTKSVGELILDDIRAIGQGIVDQANIDRASNWLMAAQDEYPLETAIVLGILSLNPTLAMTALSAKFPELKPYAKNPRVLAYLGALQRQIEGRR